VRLWKPALFSTPMVQAILDGRETQTRRVIVPQPKGYAHAWSDWLEPGDVYFDLMGGLHKAVQSRGRNKRAAGELTTVPFAPPWPVGTRLWVRETWKPWWDAHLYCTVRFRADDAIIKPELPDDQAGFRFAAECDAVKLGDAWHPSIFMAKWAARIGLEVTAVRCERVQDITEADAVAEGFPPAGESYCLPILGHAEAHGLAVGPSSVGHLCSTAGYGSPTAVTLFAGTWDLLNAKRGYGWEVNPWVFAYTFTVLSTDYAKTQRRIAEEAK